MSFNLEEYLHSKTPNQFDYKDKKGDEEETPDGWGRPSKVAVKT
jgi:hypothetical protein